MSLEFLLSAFLRQKHFSLEPFSQHLVLPVAEKHLRHSLGLCFTFYGHLLRSKWESLSWRAGARIARWALTGAAVTGCQGTEAGEVEGVTGRERQPKKGKGVKPGPGRPLEVKGKDAGSRDLAGGAVLPSPGNECLCLWFIKKTQCTQVQLSEVQFQNQMAPSGGQT